MDSFILSFLHRSCGRLQLSIMPSQVNITAGQGNHSTACAQNDTLTLNINASYCLTVVPSIRLMYSQSPDLSFSIPGVTLWVSAECQHKVFRAEPTTEVPNYFQHGTVELKTCNSIKPCWFVQLSLHLWCCVPIVVIWCALSLNATGNICSLFLCFLIFHVFCSYEVMFVCVFRDDVSSPYVCFLFHLESQTSRYPPGASACSK